MSEEGSRFLPKEADWWRGAVIYQIYPRSFQDSNGDGVGDLAGITRRLDHVASLGVDGIWISPFFTSPMKDFGYDVADYCDVDPLFGALADFDALIARAHGLGLKVFIDLVLSHTSDAHPWFAESRASRDNPRATWYVWADAKPDGSPPNNWLSIFGGSAWHWDPRRCQYYLHNFLTSQPDLNFHEPQVQAALLDVARFWLERGVDGFRLDTINFYAHDPLLRDNPALPPEARNDTIAPAVNPYNWQEHIYDKNRPETPEFLKKLHAVMAPYGAAAMGEVGDAQRGLEILGEYTSGGDKVEMCYAFELLSGPRPDAARVAEVMDHLERVAADGWPVWAYSNHDVVRHVSRWGLGEPAARAYVTLLMCLKGSACLYQGEELGLPEAEIAFEDLQDPYGREFWPAFKGRDGCRTPMPWQEDAVHGGFTTAPRPWLPLPPEHLARAVSRQEAEPDAILHHYRRAVALRQGEPALRRGAQTAMRALGPVLAFERVLGGRRLFCAFNLSGEPADIAPPAGEWRALGADLGAAEPPAPGAALALAPWQAAIWASEEERGNG